MLRWIFKRLGLVELAGQSGVYKIRLPCCSRWLTGPNLPHQSRKGKQSNSLSIFKQALAKLKEFVWRMRVSSVKSNVVDGGETLQVRMSRSIWCGPPALTRTSKSRRGSFKRNNWWLDVFLWLLFFVYRKYLLLPNLWFVWLLSKRRSTKLQAKPFTDKPH